MRLHLVRHAPTAETGKRLTGRLPGVPITVAGSEAAHEVGRALTGEGVASLYSSPVQRCRETARAIGAELGLRPTVYKSFTEVDYGTWAGRSMGSLRRTKLWKQLFVAPSRVRFPGGETLGEVQARAVAAVEALAAASPEGAVVVVSHGDVIKSVLAHYIGTPLDMFQRIVVEPLSVSTIELRPDGFPLVLAMNRKPTS